MGYRICLIVLFLISIHAYAQDNEHYAKVIRPSPTSKVFTRYGDHQPNIATGTINVPIPLFEITADNLVLPFSLQYSTSGISVWDRPVPAGYGWVFSPGLRVTRTIMGREDELYQFQQLTGAEDYETMKLGIINSASTNLVHHGLTANQLFDTQNDIFTVHLPSGNYNFLLKKSGITLIPVTTGNLVKIEVIRSASSFPINGFKITDGNGVVYIFGRPAEDTHNITQSTLIEFPAQANGFTAWMLREIVLPNQEKLNFEWKNTDISKYTRLDSEVPIGITDYFNFKCGFSPSSSPVIHDYGGQGPSDTYHYGNVKMLEKVIFPEGEVNISYLANDDPFMTKFEVKDKVGNVYRTVEFQYGANNPQFNNRLLQSLEIDGGTYSFSYNSHRFQQYSASLDYWGYYNAKNNVRIIPQMTLKGYDLFTDHVHNQPANYLLSVGAADRSVDTAAMKAYMLHRIDYPTGGYSIFEYEPHQFADHYPQSDAFSIMPAPINTGGGLRVKRVISTDVGSIPITKTYKYGVGENGKANIDNVPTLDTFIDEIWAWNRLNEDYSFLHCPIGFNVETYRSLSINPFSDYSKYQIGNTPIWYSEVSEYVNDNKTFYKFDNPDDYKTSTTQFKLIKKDGVVNYRGLFQGGPYMKEKKIFKLIGNQYTSIEETLFNYEEVYYGDIQLYNSIIDRQIVFSGVPGGGDLPESLRNTLANGDLNEIKYKWRPYRIDLSYYQLKEKLVTSIENNQEITQKETYVYSGFRNALVSKVTRFTSVGDTMVTEYKYPGDFSDSFNQIMQSKNIIAPVIEQVDFLGGHEINRLRTNYMNTSSMIRPHSILHSTRGIDSLITKVIFDYYSPNGKLLQQKRHDAGLVTSYIWGYNGQYPIAEITNATYIDVLGILGQGVLDQLNSFVVTDEYIRQKIAELRTALPQAQIVGYTYRPLVGISSKTDPRGVSEFYEYDSFQRLWLIRDQDRNILKRFDYNYR